MLFPGKWGLQVRYKGKCKEDVSNRIPVSLDFVSYYKLMKRRMVMKIHTGCRRFHNGPKRFHTAQRFVSSGRAGSSLSR